MYRLILVERIGFSEVGIEKKGSVVVVLCSQTEPRGCAETSESYTIVSQQVGSMCSLAVARRQQDSLNDESCS